MTAQLGKVLEVLGRDAFLWALRKGLLPQLEGQLESWAALASTREKAKSLKADLERLSAALDEAASSVEALLGDRLGEGSEDAVPHVSDKVAALVARLRRLFEERGEDGAFRGMVFVQEVALATPLAWLLKTRLASEVVVVTGTSAMKEEVRNTAYRSFRGGLARVLVCTSCAEEGYMLHMTYIYL